MSGLQPALQRTQIELDKLPHGSIVIDRFGDAWQESRNYWYRAYGDSSEVSSWELCQRAPITLATPAPKALARVKIALEPAPLPVHNTPDMLAYLEEMTS